MGIIDSIKYTPGVSQHIKGYILGMIYLGAGFGAAKIAIKTGWCQVDDDESY